MKKRLLLKGLFAALMLGSPLSGMAYNFSAKDINDSTIYYTITDATNLTCEVASGSYSGNIVIPESVTYSGNTYKVTSIGNFAFCLCKGLTSVVIPSSVTSIGDRAFQGCVELTSVTIPSSVTSIGNRTFYNCNIVVYLTSTTVPTIGTKTFTTDSLKALYVPVGQKEDYAEDDDWSDYSSKMIGYIPSASTKAPMNVDGFDDGYWGTIYTDSAMKVPEGITVYTVSSLNADKSIANVKQVASAGDSIPAGGYLISSAESNDTILFVQSSEEANVTIEDNLLKGCVVDSTIQGGDKYYMLTNNSSGEKYGFYWASEGGTSINTKAYKAYLPISSASSAKTLMLVSDSYATGINSVSSDAAKSGKIYNLQGIEVSEPAQGLYIKNGKKIIK